MTNKYFSNDKKLTKLQKDKKPLTEKGYKSFDTYAQKELEYINSLMDSIYKAKTIEDINKISNTIVTHTGLGKISLEEAKSMLEIIDYKHLAWEDEMPKRLNVLEIKLLGKISESIDMGERIGKLEEFIRNNP